MIPQPPERSACDQETSFLTLPLAMWAEIRPYPGAERRGGVIGREHNYAYTVVPVEEIVGSDKFLRDWYRHRVAPVQNRSFSPAVRRPAK